MPVGDPWRKLNLARTPQAPSSLARPRTDLPAPERDTETGENEPETRAPAMTSLARHPVPTPPYRLATFAVLAWVVALLLAALDEYWTLPHAAAINATLFLTAVLIIFSLLSALRRARAWRRAHGAASAEFRDRVTGLPNYRYLLLRLEEEASRARRYRRPLALAVVDVNSLHSVNTQYGWACGDQVLRHVARVMQGCLRSSDLAARLADDRFAIIVPECDERSAHDIIDRLEQRLARSPAQVDVDGEPLHLWVGICTGLAVLREESESAGDLVHSAEDDLQAAKEERDKRRRLWLSA